MSAAQQGGSQSSRSDWATTGVPQPGAFTVWICLARPDPSNPILGCLGLESFNNLDINQDPRDQQDERCMGITLVLFLVSCIQLHMADYMG